MIRISLKHAIDRSIFRKQLSTNVIQALRERSLVEHVTSDKLEPQSQRSLGVYCGVDPTAVSMHLGNLLTMMSLLQFYLHGHQIISLVGGATGIIGDPTGRETERTSMTELKLAENVSGVQSQMKSFFQNATQYAQKRVAGVDTAALKPILFLNNYEWYKNMNVLEFLRLVGRNARVRNMLSRESVKTRLASAEGGMSFTEFSYQLFQAYDFYYLNKHHNCNVQVGGSDQWGNITAGIDLISRLNNQEAQHLTEAETDSSQGSKDAFGLTIPLLVSKSGKKYGKSAGNAVWLNPSLTSPYEFYQYFMRTPDSDLELLLKKFTLLPLEKIDEILDQHNKIPERKTGQSALAAEVTELIHGEDQLANAIHATSYLFGKRSFQKDSISDGKPTEANLEYLVSALQNDPRLVTYPESKLNGVKITEIAVLANACKSKSEAFRLIKNNGLYWNNKRVVSEHWVPDLEQDYFGSPKIAVLRVGKAFFHVLKLE